MRSVAYVFIIFAAIFISFTVAVSTYAKTCSDEWGSSCNSNINDSLGCDGVQGDKEHVLEVWVEPGGGKIGDGVTVTCTFEEHGNETRTDYEYIFYNNGGGWITVFQTESNASGVVNRSANVTLTGSEGKHWFRCTISSAPINDFCADVEAQERDNDDVGIDVAPNFGISSVWFEYMGKSINEANLNQNVSVFSEVYGGPESVEIRVVKPNGEELAETMTSDGDVWTFSFGDNMPLNAEGNYTVNVTAFKSGYGTSV